MKPYTYVLQHIPSGKFYVGSKYGRNADPDSLWKTYFTSSKVIKELVTRDGVSSFKIIELHLANTRQEAIDFEGQLQLSYPKWQLLNKRLANIKFNMFGPHSRQHCANISAARKGKPLLGQRGKPKSPAAVAKMAATKTGQPYRGDRVAMAKKVSATLTGRKHTVEHRKHLSEAKTGKTLGPQTPEHVAKRVASMIATNKKRGPRPPRTTSAETKSRQAAGKARTPRVACSKCTLLVTPQNIRRHEVKCGGRTCA